MLRIGALELRTSVLLAPMASVTDLPLRTISEEYGAAMTFTELLPAPGLLSGAAGALAKLQPSVSGRPFGVQLFGRVPESLARAAELAVAAGAALVDLNMGCPSRRIIASECGVALMRTPALARDIVRAVRSSLPAHVPVSVKHRAGWDEQHKNAPELAAQLVEAGAAMITVHGRTRAQGFGGRADLDIIRRVREVLPRQVMVVGNGDVVDVESYRRMRGETGCDAVMIGRGAVGNPFLFRAIRLFEETGVVPGPPTMEERAAALARHLALVRAQTRPERQHHELRKVCVWYVRGIAGAAALRKKMHESSSAEDIVAWAVGLLDVDAR
ncbi:MAG: tRNA dihydrouridine synthase DusB [Pseudomonadota bacterium]